MFEQISNLVKEFGQQSVVENPAIPNDQNNAVLAEATHTITGGMQNMLAGGGLQDILSLFTGGGNNNQSNSQSGGISGLLNNPAVASMVSNFVSSLMNKFNMSHAQATSVSNSLIPNVLNGLITRTTSTDPANSAFDLNSLIGSLTGGNVATKQSGGGFDFQGLLNQFTSGGGNAGGGGFNLDNIINEVTQGAQQHQQQQQAKSGGGIEDMIKGFFN
ncbi:MAG: hypothetical protein ABUT20_21470 [Bacteroidota bacterium]